jgi:ABC-type transport system substrate-binding protein
MQSKKWQLLTLVLVLALVVPLVAACGATPVVTEKETVVVTEKEEVEVTTVVKEEVVVTATPPPEPTPLPEGFIQRGGTLRTEYNWMPYVSDPAIDGVGTGQVGLAIAEPLIWVSGDGVPRPNLVKSWEASEDAMEWTLHLQEGVHRESG